MLPFPNHWAGNTDLEPDLSLRQVGILRRVGDSEAQRYGPLEPIVYLVGR